MEPLNVKREEDETREAFTSRVLTMLALPIRLVRIWGEYYPEHIICPDRYEYALADGALYHRPKGTGGFYVMCVVALNSDRSELIMCECGCTAFNISQEMLGYCVECGREYHI